MFVSMMGEYVYQYMIRKTASVVRVLPTFTFRWVENVVCRKWKSPRSCSGSWTLETVKTRSVSRWDCKNNSLMNSLCNLPDVLPITGVKETVRGGLLFRVFIMNHENCYYIHHDISVFYLFIMNQENESSRQDLYMSVGAMKD